MLFNKRMASDDAQLNEIHVIMLEVGVQIVVEVMLSGKAECEGSRPCRR